LIVSTYISFHTTFLEVTRCVNFLDWISFPWCFIYLVAVPCCFFHSSSLQPDAASQTLLSLFESSMEVLCFKPIKCNLTFLYCNDVIISLPLISYWVLEAEKVKWTRCREYGGSETRVMQFLSRNSCTDKAEWAALSFSRNQYPVCHFQDVFVAHLSIDAAEIVVHSLSLWTELLMHNVINIENDTLNIQHHQQKSFHFWTSRTAHIWEFCPLFPLKKKVLACCKLP
jgi:hypothetical protein